MSVITAASRGVKIVLQDAVSALGNGLALAIPTSCKHHTLYIKGSAGIASGKVQPESSDDPDYTGTWAQIGGGEITVVASTELQVSFEGAFAFIRCRVSTVLVGGTVTVTYEGY